jgi:hypothetical protein
LGTALFLNPPKTPKLVGFVYNASYPGPVMFLNKCRRTSQMFKR